MAIKKSKPYLIDGSNYSFEFGDDGKMIGIKKQDANGDFQPVDPASDEFAGLELSDQALNAYNINKFGGNTNAYEEILDISVDLLKQQLYDSEKKKSNNAQFVDNNTEQPLAFSTPRDGFAGYARRAKMSEVMAYPLDIDTNQDHMKITRYEYRRPTVNQSKPAGKVRRIDLLSPQTGFIKEYNVAGDTVKGSKIGGSIILPMPKATDVNAVAWGKSELNIQGLAAVGAAQKAAGLSGLLGLNVTGKSAEDTGKDFVASLRNGEGMRKMQNTGAGIRGFGQANATNFITKLAGGAFGTELNPDTFLARHGGRVLNPNAEMLFQGPAIRDFAFEFTMIARSEEEGKEIRRIIRFLKLGMAPKFQSTTFIANPDVFQLEYKSGTGDGDMLKTVNQFNPGGLALTSMNVDYAPSGYWSAYQDSQPVVLKMGLNFTELRPIFQGDQEVTPEDSVGL